MGQEEVQVQTDLNDDKINDNDDYMKVQRDRHVPGGLCSRSSTLTTCWPWRAVSWGSSLFGSVRRVEVVKNFMDVRCGEEVMVDRGEG